MIVDGQERIFQLTREILINCNYEVKTVCGGERCLAEVGNFNQT